MGGGPQPKQSGYKGGMSGVRRNYDNVLKSVFWKVLKSVPCLNCLKLRRGFAMNKVVSLSVKTYNFLINTSFDNHNKFYN